MRLQKSDDEKELIKSAFSNKTLQSFADYVQVVKSLLFRNQPAKIEAFIVQKLRSGKDSKQLTVVEKHASCFVCEFLHFC